MFTITDKLNDEVEIDGKTYSLNLFFDNVILLFELFDDDKFSDNEKIEIAFEMLVTTDDDDFIPFDLQFVAVKTIVDDYILPDDGSSDNDGNGEKMYDFKQDAPYIYSSFLQEYNIDLVEQQGKLRWEKFNALMSGLRDDTRFKDIVGIRATKLPTGKENKEERQRLQKLKKLYALKKDQKAVERKLDAMFNALSNGR